MRKQEALMPLASGSQAAGECKRSGGGIIDFGCSQVLVAIGAAVVAARRQDFPIELGGGGEILPRRRHHWPARDRSTGRIIDLRSSQSFRPVKTAHDNDLAVLEHGGGVEFPRRRKGSGGKGEGAAGGVVDFQAAQRCAGAKGKRLSQEGKEALKLIPKALSTRKATASASGHR